MEKEQNESALFNNPTPCDNVSLDGYEAAFEYVFGNEEIHNIAISESYDFGKSSVLNSYIKKQYENCEKTKSRKNSPTIHSFLIISLLIIVFIEIGGGEWLIIPHGK